MFLYIYFILCIRSTVFRLCKKHGKFRNAPNEDVGAKSPRRKTSRKQFVDTHLTPVTKKLSNRAEMWTTIDHKLVYKFAENKSRTKQFRRDGSDKPLRVRPTSQTNLSAMVCFAANKFGTASFIHANKTPFKSDPRRGQLKAQKITVNGPEMARAIKNKIDW